MLSAGTAVSNEDSACTIAGATCRQAGTHARPHTRPHTHPHTRTSTCTHAYPALTLMCQVSREYVAVGKLCRPKANDGYWRQDGAMRPAGRARARGHTGARRRGHGRTGVRADVCPWEDVPTQCTPHMHTRPHPRVRLLASSCPFLCKRHARPCACAHARAHSCTDARAHAPGIDGGPEACKRKCDEDADR